MKISWSFSVESGCLKIDEELRRKLRKLPDEDVRAVADLFKPRSASPSIRTIPKQDELVQREASEHTFHRLGFDWETWSNTFPKNGPPADYEVPVVWFDEATLLNFACFTALCSHNEYKLFLRVERSEDGKVLKVVGYDMVPLQTVAALTVKHSDDREMMVTMLAHLRGTTTDVVYESLRGDIHSHVDEGVYPSSPDRRKTFCYAAGLGEPSLQWAPLWWLSVIVNRCGDIYIYYVDLEKGVMVENPPWVIFNPLASDEARLALVKESLPITLLKLQQNIVLYEEQQSQQKVELPAGATYGTAEEFAEYSLPAIPAFSPHAVRNPQDTDAPEPQATTPEEPRQAVKPLPARSTTAVKREYPVKREPWIAFAFGVVGLAVLALVGLQFLSSDWHVGFGQKESAQVVPQPQVAETPVVAAVAPVAPVIPVQPSVPVSQPTPQPTLEATPVAQVEETPPVAAIVAVPAPLDKVVAKVEETPPLAAVSPVTPPADAVSPQLPVPPLATKSVEERAKEIVVVKAPQTPPPAEVVVTPVATKTLKEELRERFQGVTRPERVWPDPRNFDKVSTEMLEQFGVMTVDEFKTWSLENPKASLRVPKVIRAAFDEANEARIGDSICEACLAADPQEGCNGLAADAKALFEHCNQGVKWLGEDEKPLSKVLAERKSRKSRMK